MGLYYGLLNKKKEIELKGEKCQDLLTKTFNDNIPLAGYVTFTTVSHEYIGRPDLISLALYGTDEYGDILCKINGISNPFELNEGMELVCPVQSIIDYLTDVVDTEVGDALIKDDNGLIQKVENNKKTNNQLRSPNEATITDTNYTVTDDNMLVIY